MSIDHKIDAFFAPISEAVFDVVFFSVPLFGQDVKLLLVWIMSAAIFFTVYLGFVNFRYFVHGLQVALGKFDNKKDDGEISSFQALMASLSGTVGLGNIAGVAVAVSVGGPGAVFWMIVMGLLSMSSKFAEVTLGMIYRVYPSKEHPERLSGGPMFYLREGLKKKGYPSVGKVLSLIFASFCLLSTLGSAGLFQTNQAFQQVYEVTGGDAGFFAGRSWLFGLFMAFLTGVVIIGGIKSIANVAAAIVPFMGIAYVTLALVIVAINYQAVPEAFGDIFTQALSLEAGIGGLLGGLLVGIQRAAFSNEAGLGTAAILYSAARSKYPAMQGMASMIGPFLDTVIVCTATALMIITTGVHEGAEGMAGVEMTSAALGSVFSWSPYALAFVVFLFAYSTLITFAYYGSRSINFIFGESDRLSLTYKLLLLVFISLGASVDLHSIIDLTDGFLLGMAIPNILGLYILAPEVKKELQKYLKKMKI